MTQYLLTQKEQIFLVNEINIQVSPSEDSFVTVEPCVQSVASCQVDVSADLPQVTTPRTPAGYSTSEAFDIPRGTQGCLSNLHVPSDPDPSSR